MWRRVKTYRREGIVLYFNIGLEIGMILLLLFCSVTDCLWKKIWLPALLAAVPVIIICLVGRKGNLSSHLLCGGLCCGGFLAVSLVTDGQIEKGDGAILGIVALSLGGWKTITCLFASFSYAFVVAVFLVVVRKRKGKDRMPFVPFALAGYLTVLLLERMG